jgi:N4-(beta-N-acetylglucosaminyl)-L-asparaginase
MQRREFLKKTVLLSAVLAAPPITQSQQAPEVMTRKGIRPVVISAENGNWFKNRGKQTCVERAYQLMIEGKDVLEALIAGVNIVELDPEDDSVGYGGLPNADGVVQLDSCCMHGPKKRAGGVAALEGIRTPSRVAWMVMEQTDHHLIVGEGAQRFARHIGFTVEDDLNTENSRKAWLEWKRKTDPEHYLNPEKRSEMDRKIMREIVAQGIRTTTRMHGTINCNGINAKGEICGVTTTSGLSWKIPGRVGDSPILGAGLYVDGEIGAAGSTGRGEANLFNLSCYLVVEALRRGMHPKDAGIEALKRIRANTVEKRLRKANGDPNFNVNFYVLNAKGEHAGVGMYGEDDDEKGWAGQEEGRFIRYSWCDENGPRTVPVEPLLPGTSDD